MTPLPLTLQPRASRPLEGFRDSGWWESYLRCGRPRERFVEFQIRARSHAFRTPPLPTEEVPWP